MKLLDHGYVKYVEHWGSDERIIESARMSTDKGFQGWGPLPCNNCVSVGTGKPTGIVLQGGSMVQCPKCKGTEQLPGDEKLLRRLWEHGHHSPFEMAGLTIEVQAPVFVFREWHRHRTQSYNELSARYTPLPDLCYLPSVERLRMGKQATKNKQSSEDGISAVQAAVIQAALTQVYMHNRKVYESLLAVGLARELARLVVPVAQYSRMRAQANLRNWLAFLTLRQAEGAQWEIRQYADAVGTLIQQYFPKTHALFVEGRK